MRLCHAKRKVAGRKEWSQRPKQALKSTPRGSHGGNKDVAVESTLAGPLGDSLGVVAPAAAEGTVAVALPWETVGGVYKHVAKWLLRNTGIKIHNTCKASKHIDKRCGRLLSGVSGNRAEVSVQWSPVRSATLVRLSQKYMLQMCWGVNYSGLLRLIWPLITVYGYMLVL